MNMTKKMANTLTFCSIRSVLPVISITRVALHGYLLKLLFALSGYKGESARRIWRSIYEENCFLKRSDSSPFSYDNMCYEERVFYRAISGLHSSINIHLCSSYHYMDGTFSFNKQEFIKRFEGMVIDVQQISFSEFTNFYFYINLF